MQNDFDVAIRYLFVDLAIKNLKLDLHYVTNGPFKIKNPYTNLIEQMVSVAIHERRKLKRIMFNRRIQILFLHKQGDFSTYQIIANGSEYENTFMNQVIKKNVEKIMQEFMGKI